VELYEHDTVDHGYKGQQINDSVSDISAQDIRDSLTTVWEELLNTNNCSSLSLPESLWLPRKSETHPSPWKIIFFFFNWLECLHISYTVARPL